MPLLPGCVASAAVALAPPRQVAEDTWKTRVLVAKEYCLSKEERVYEVHRAAEPGPGRTARTLSMGAGT